MDREIASKSGKKRKLSDPGDVKPKKLKASKEKPSDNDFKKEEWLADVEKIDWNVSCNLIRLIEGGNTIPFIARYRQHLTNGMDPEKLRHIKESYDTLLQIQVKAEALLKTVAKEGPIDPVLAARVQCAKSLEEIGLLAAPFKKGSKTTLVARAREAGLEESGLALLHGTHLVCPSELVNPDTPGRENVKKVLTGLQHIMADAIAKDAAILEFLEKLKARERITLDCSERKGECATGDKEKYALYFNFSQDVQCIQEHQVLAINRGEVKKVLSVKVNIPKSFWDRVKVFCSERWISKGKSQSIRSSCFESAIDDAINRLLSPLVSRQIRNRLTETAERSSIDVFSTNLKCLLLSAPLRGKVVMAIDPGIKNGCKIGIVSPFGEPLLMDKIYLNDDHGRRRGTEKLVEWIRFFHCETVAIGNGTYCRETESFLAELIQKGSFRPLDVAYTIVNEQGVSIYSCSPVASEEFPNTDPNLISAVSLARRLQDPLAELVKVEPKHLGVGMYQHDLPEKKLSASLEEVVSECVSFVGVDLNTASVHLLRRVAGLTRSRADAIIACRQTNGPFQNREQLLKLKGIGAKTYQQCAGFIRILPSTAMSQANGNPKTQKNSLNPLDQTEIHPDDYSFATRYLKGIGLNVDDIGSPEFIRGVKHTLQGTSLKVLAEAFDVSELQMAQLTGALQRPPDHDLRNLSQAPLFKRGITSIDSLKPGEPLTGMVRNVVNFGAFVDVGVGVNGLIHSSQLGRDRTQWVQLGDKVDVIVVSVDVRAKRIGLRLVHK